MITKEEISTWFRSLQDDICKALETEDGKAKFEEDKWVREGGGGGRTRILQNGNVIEKGGVNFSEVFGATPSFLEKTSPSAHLGETFFATGVSIVMHPQSPMVPIIHTNVRYFESGNERWFGGGIDLTPHYVNEEDAKHFHRTLKEVCDKHHHTYYPEFKKWADEYFYNPHRCETRGVGGIFFDHLTAPPPPEGGSASNQEQSYGYETADPILYGLIKEFVRKHRSVPTEAENVFWQLVRGKSLEGFKFRRQHIIGSYIADFVCLKEKLIIEIDGLIHQLPENKEGDVQRTNWLNEKGFRVLRFKNEEVIGNSNGVLNKILYELRLPPSGGGGAFDFVKDVGNCFAPLYTSLMKKNKSLPYTEKEKQWQYMRRGRYVEFNLVYDRGTKFGLKTNGRTESILMSLPPQANWTYNFKPEKGSAEEKTLSYLKKGIDWVEK